ncbi:E3 ubiquitin-protein ligase BRE1-like 1 [Apostasia shenzhenica]|uniref:E3 ubiquitin protein ligase n=1 Tax=Apostasia shenzhenica TaxID=1088818 RepID=A0A2I0B8N6_9ASPA|nr:E3 ubiquitin-protein ligase BRE1-like 1 [Apostasia shenzhenica]
MVNTGEPDMKRRHFSSVSPTAVSAAKRHLVSPFSDEKKLDVTVLQYQNQKLFQQLEAQKVECCVLADKYDKLREHKEIFENIVMVSRKSWEQLVSELESCSIRTSESANVLQDSHGSQMLEDGVYCPVQDDLLHRLLETGAAEYGVDDESSDNELDEAQMMCKKTETILQNIISSINGIRHGSELVSALQVKLSENQDLASNRFQEISSLHEERIEFLKKLVNLQNVLVDVKSIFSSRTFLKLGGQLDKSKAEMDQYRLSLEKLQVVTEKEKFLWHEKEVSFKEDIAVLAQKFTEFSESRIAELEQELQKLVHDYSQMEKKLEEALTVPGQSVIIADFKVLVLSLPKEIGVLQNELCKYKESSAEIHCLRAQLQYLSGQLVMQIRDLRQSEEELKLIMEMYMRESTESSDVVESRNMEYRAWACVRTVESSLDECNLELRVKAAVEGEAISQQRLAAAEAKILDLRKKLELSLRDISESSESLKSKDEESETYLSEIESIGQAYEDMQTQNHNLLMQITERDDYNIKLVMEGVRERQMQDTLSGEIQTIDRKILVANSLIDIYGHEVARSDEQLNYWSGQAPKLQEDGSKSSLTLGNSQRRLTDLQTGSQGLRQSLSDIQILAEKSRLEVTELLIELEKERFNKKRIEEGLETLTMKATFLRSRNDGLDFLQKLQNEVGEYRGILKCRVCNDHQKEVVIAKCYHLFCSECVRRTIESRHRRCPTCSASFGPNDIKPIYI